MTIYSYDEFYQDIQVLAKDIYEKFDPDALLAVARGGLTMGHFLAELLDNRELYSVNAVSYNETQKTDTLTITNLPDLSDKKKILIIDDIVDSGDTMKKLIQMIQEKYPNATIKIATIFYKSTASISPDFSIRPANDWIEFFWEHYQK